MFLLLYMTRNMQPTHYAVSRLLHAIVFDIHHRDSARLAGDTLKEADYQLDLDLMKKSYWQYHAREQERSIERSTRLGVSDSARFTPETYIRGAR